MELRKDCEAQTIPPLAHKLRKQLEREVKFYWGSDEPISTFAAQIHQESVWVPDAESCVGASGLAQFMPSTADWISKLYPKDLGENQPLDVKWALRACVMYDKFLYDRIFSLDLWEMVLSSYNGGLIWLNRDRDLTHQKHYDDDFWWGNVELFSNRSPGAFKENREYVRRILKVLRPFYEKEGWR